MPLTNQFGLYVGVLTKVKISPVLTSTATIAPRLSLSTDSAFFCMSKSIVKYRLLPAIAGVVILVSIILPITLRSICISPLLPCKIVSYCFSIPVFPTKEVPR